MDFSLIDYLDEDACYTKLVELLHPEGLGRPALRRRGNDWGSTAATATRSWTTSAASAAASSTPGRGPPWEGRTAVPGRSS